MSNPSCVRCSDGPPKFCACLYACGHILCGAVAVKDTDAAREEAHRAQMLSRLLRVWRAFPTLRLAQLIENVFPHEISGYPGTGSEDPYHMEDEEYIRCIEDTYRKIREGK